MRIGFVSHSSDLGGAERSLADTLSALSEQGIEVCASVPRTGPLCEWLDKLGIPHVILAYGWWARQQPDSIARHLGRHGVSMASVGALAAYFATRRCDLIVSNTVTTYVGAFTALALRRPHVWMLREVKDQWTFDFGERFSRAVMRASTTLFVANSTTTAASYEGYLPADRIEVVYQWVRTAAVSRRLRAVDDPRLCCVSVGQLVPQKGQLDAVEAVRIMRNRGIPAELELVGGGCGEYRDLLERVAIEAGLGRHVRFHGYLADPTPLLEAADVVVVSARDEGFGRVTGEAMLAGIPVVGCRSGATSELIQHGETGLLYEPGNPEHLASQLETINADRPRAAATADRAKLRAEKLFGRSIFCKTLISAFEAVIDERRVR